MKQSLEEKIKKSKRVIRKALKKFPTDKIVVAWTGGKDSTLIIWLVLQVCQKNKLPLPTAMFIDEGDVFKEMIVFVKKWSQEWKLKVDFAQNTDVINQVKKIGDPVDVKKLSQRNQRELGKLGFKEKSFPFEPESYIGNHLMKTVAMNIYLEKHGTQALMTGIRWDEQPARANETFFSPRKDPDHVRVHPILHFDERNVWQAIHNLNIPYAELYESGFRSLGAKGTTGKASDTPDWKQDLNQTTEREGRHQDKEKIMARLRQLGYM